MEVKREYYLNWFDEVPAVVIIDTGMYYDELSVDVITDSRGYITKYISSDIEKCDIKADQYLGELREKYNYNHMVSEKGFVRIE